MSLIASSALVASIFLTSCASSPSLEEQTKLVEYENCLEAELQMWLLQGQNDKWSGDTLNWLEGQWEKDEKVLADFILEDCKKFRP